MGNGLRYETGRDMPPGMQELTADKIVQHLREAVAVAATAPVPEAVVPLSVPAEPLQTNGDRIRAMSDEDLAEKFFWIYRQSCEHGGVDISQWWCDCKGGCQADEVEFDCDGDMHKACILRWLRAPVLMKNINGSYPIGGCMK